ncbi:MAG: hypothetical protein WCI54_13030 [Bacteroidia bacterium]
MRSKFHTGIVVSLAFLLFGCSPALYLPTSADAGHAGTSVDSLLIGREMYVKSCGSCHSLRQPERYSRSIWLQAMPKMQVKAKISVSDAKLITSFVLARCKPE